MPIYEYRCAACGFQKEYLQKMSDPLLTDCPECGKASFSKMVTAAGFQLKGSGWYVTDFRQGSGAKSDGGGKPGAKTETKADAKSDAAPAAAPADSKPAADTAAKKTESSSTGTAANTSTSGGS